MESPVTAKPTDVLCETMGVRMDAHRHRYGSAIRLPSGKLVRVLTIDDLAIETLDGENYFSGAGTIVSSPLSMPSRLTTQQEPFNRDCFSIKLEGPQTGRWIRSRRTEGLDHGQSGP